MVSQGFKDILSDGAWAAASGADKLDPTDFGLTRADGFPVAYEQIGSGKEPVEREVFNEREYEFTASLIDIAAHGPVPEWDVEVDYTPASDAACFVTTSTGLHVTRMNTGPTYGNATDPDASGQAVWTALLMAYRTPRQRQGTPFSSEDIQPTGP